MNEYMSKHTLLKRTISFTVLFAFCMCFVLADAWAAMDTGISPSTVRIREKSHTVNPNEDMFNIPAYLGEIKDSFKSVSDKFVIHIQDAHCNYAAQYKIAEIIEYLNAEYGITTINLEGGTKEYDLSIFTDIDDTQRRENLTDYFVKEGLINGAEYFAANNPGKIKLWGVEDIDLYLKNLNTYRNSLKHRDEVDRYISSLEQSLNILKQHIFSEELLELDKICSGYKAEDLEFKDYLIHIVEKAKEKGIDIRSFQNIDLLYGSIKNEEKIDFKKANRQRETLIDRLSGKLSDRELEDLVAKVIKFKEEKITSEGFYGYLIEKAKTTSIGLEGFQEIQKYIEYIAKYNTANISGIMPELDRLLAELNGKLYENEKQKELYQLSRYLTLLKDFFNVTLTREDYDYYAGTEDKFVTGNFIEFIKRASSIYKIPLDLVDLDEDISKLDQYRKEMARFYEWSFKRDEVFIDSLLFTIYDPQTTKPIFRVTSHPSIPLRADEPRAAILITGGFHSDNLHKIFKERDISYISVMPNFKNDKKYECPYSDLLTGNNHGFLKFVQPAISMIAIYSYFCGNNTLRVHGVDIMELNDEIERLKTGKEKSVVLSKGQFALVVSAKKPKGGEKIPGIIINEKKIWLVKQNRIKKITSLFTIKDRLSVWLITFMWITALFIGIVRIGDALGGTSPVFQMLTPTSAYSQIQAEKLVQRTLGAKKIKKNVAYSSLEEFKKLSGVSLYLHYGTDIGGDKGFSKREKELTDFFIDLKEKGINLVRIFTFCDLRNGAVEFDEHGKPMGFDGSSLEDFKVLIRAANKTGVQIMPVLFDHTLADGIDREGKYVVGEHPNLFLNPDHQNALLGIFETFLNSLKFYIEENGFEKTILAFEPINEASWLKLGYVRDRYYSKKETETFVMNFVNLLRKVFPEKPISLSAFKRDEVEKWKPFLKPGDILQIHWYEYMEAWYRSSYNYLDNSKNDLDVPEGVKVIFGEAEPSDIMKVVDTVFKNNYDGILFWHDSNFNFLNSPTKLKNFNDWFERTEERSNIKRETSSNRAVKGTNSTSLYNSLFGGSSLYEKGFSDSTGQTFLEEAAETMHSEASKARALEEIYKAIFRGDENLVEIAEKHGYSLEDIISVDELRDEYIKSWLSGQLDRMMLVEGLLTKLGRVLNIKLTDENGYISEKAIADLTARMISIELRKYFDRDIRVIQPRSNLKDYHYFSDMYQKAVSNKDFDPEKHVLTEIHLNSNSPPVEKDALLLERNTKGAQGVFVRTTDGNADNPKVSGPAIQMLGPFPLLYENSTALLEVTDIETFLQMQFGQFQDHVADQIRPLIQDLEKRTGRKTRFIPGHGGNTPGGMEGTALRSRNLPPSGLPERKRIPDQKRFFEEQEKIVIWLEDHLRNNKSMTARIYSSDKKVSMAAYRELYSAYVTERKDWDYFTWISSDLTIDVQCFDLSYIYPTVTFELALRDAGLMKNEDINFYYINYYGKLDVVRRSSFPGGKTGDVTYTQRILRLAGTESALGTIGIMSTPVNDEIKPGAFGITLKDSFLITNVREKGGVSIKKSQGGNHYQFKEKDYYVSNLWLTSFSYLMPIIGPKNYDLNELRKDPQNILNSFIREALTTDKMSDLGKLNLSKLLMTLRTYDEWGIYKTEETIFEEKIYKIQQTIPVEKRVHLFTSLLLHSDNNEVECNAANYLTELYSKEQVDPTNYQRIINAFKRCIKSASWSKIHACLTALEHMQTEEAIDLFGEAARRHDNQVEAVFNMLTRISENTDIKPKIRKKAKKTLEWVKKKRVRLMQNKSSDLREPADTGRYVNGIVEDTSENAIDGYMLAMKKESERKLKNETSLKRRLTPELFAILPNTIRAIQDGDIVYESVDIFNRTRIEKEGSFYTLKPVTFKMLTGPGIKGKLQQNGLRKDVIDALILLAESTRLRGRSLSLDNLMAVLGELDPNNKTSGSLLAKSSNNEIQEHTPGGSWFRSRAYMRWLAGWFGSLVLLGLSGISSKASAGEMIGRDYNITSGFIDILGQAIPEIIAIGLVGILFWEFIRSRSEEVQDIQRKGITRRTLLKRGLAGLGYLALSSIASKVKAAETALEMAKPRGKYPVSLEYLYSLSKKDGIAYLEGFYDEVKSGRVNRDTAEKFLRRIFENEDILWMRGAAIKTLIKLGIVAEDGWDKLVRSVPDRYLLGEIASGIGQVGTRESVKYLIELCEREAYTRNEAGIIFALGQTKTREAEEYIIGQFGEEITDFLRDQILLSALGNTGEDAAVEYAIREYKKAETEERKFHILRLLKALNTKKALAFLRERVFIESNSRVKSAMQCTLDLLKNKGSADKVMELYKKYPAEKEDIIHELGQLKDSKSKAYLEDLFAKETNWYARCCYFVPVMDPERVDEIAVELITQFKKETDSEKKDDMFYALAILSSRKVTNYLMTLFERENNPEKRKRIALRILNDGTKGIFDFVSKLVQSDHRLLFGVGIKNDLFNHVFGYKLFKKMQQRKSAAVNTGQRELGDKWRSVIEDYVKDVIDNELRYMNREVGYNVQRGERQLKEYFERLRNYPYMCYLILALSHEITSHSFPAAYKHFRENVEQKYGKFDVLKYISEVENNTFLVSFLFTMTIFGKLEECLSDTAYSPKDLAEKFLSEDKVEVFLGKPVLFFKIVSAIMSFENRELRDAFKEKLINITGENLKLRVMVKIMFDIGIITDEIFAPIAASTDIPDVDPVWDGPQKNWVSGEGVISVGLYWSTEAESERDQYNEFPDIFTNGAKIDSYYKNFKGYIDMTKTPDPVERLKYKKKLGQNRAEKVLVKDFGSGKKIEIYLYPHTGGISNSPHDIVISRGHAGDEGVADNTSRKGVLRLASHCRSINDSDEIIKKNPDNAVIAITGEGRGNETNPVIYYLLEYLGTMDEWGDWQEVKDSIRPHIEDAIKKYNFPTEEKDDISLKYSAILSKIEQQDPAYISFIGKLLDKEDIVIEKDISAKETKMDGRYFLEITHKNLMEPVLVSINTDKNGEKSIISSKTIAEKLAGFYKNKKDYMEEGVRKNIESTINNLLDRINETRELIVLDHHETVKGAFGYNADGEKVLYLNKQLMEHPMALIHELGEGFARAPEGMTNHTFMRGVGSDVRRAFNMLSAEDQSLSKADELITALENKLADMTRSKEDHISETRRKQKSRIGTFLTESEQKLIKWNFIENKQPGRHALYGIQDWLDPGGNTRFTQEIRLITQDLRRGTLNLFLIPESDRAGFKSKMFTVCKEVERNFRKKRGINTHIVSFKQEFDEEEFRKKLRDMFDVAIAEENKALLPKIYVDCPTAMHVGTAKAFISELQKEHKDINVENIFGIANDPLGENDIIDEVKVVLVGSALMDDRRLKEVYKDRMNDEYFKSRRAYMLRFFANNNIIEHVFDYDDPAELDRIIQDIWAGNTVLRITPINWETLREWKDSQDKVMRSL